MRLKCACDNDNWYHIYLFETIITSDLTLFHIHCLKYMKFYSKTLLCFLEWKLLLCTICTTFKVHEWSCQVSWFNDLLAFKELTRGIFSYFGVDQLEFSIEYFTAPFLKFCLSSQFVLVSTFLLQISLIPGQHLFLHFWRLDLQEPHFFIQLILFSHLIESFHFKVLWLYHLNLQSQY